MRKIRILFCIESLSCGGAEKSLMSLLNKIDQNKYEIDVLVYKIGGEFEKFLPASMNLKTIDFKPNFFDRIKFKVSRIFNRKRNYHNAQLLWKSIKNSMPIYRGDYEIAIAWGQGFATYFVSKKVISPMKIAWVNTDYKKAGYNANQDQSIYKEFHKIIGVSPYVKEELEKLFPQNDVEFIRDVIDEDEIETWSNHKIEYKFNNDEVNIISVGRLAKAKAFDLAINAAKIVNEKGFNIHLYIVGEGPERLNLESLIVDKNMESHVTLLGYLENPFPYIKGGDIYLQSSIFEGLGRTVIEAGILKKPIISTNFPTASQILTNNVTGLIVEMNPDSIANSIIELINNGNLKNKLIGNLSEQLGNETEKNLKTIYKLFDQAGQVT